MISEESDIHTLEIRNLAFHSTIDRDKCLARLYSPPLIAQFLNDIRLEAHSGQLHGILGAAGNGKTILLEALSCRAAGDITGTVLLDSILLSKHRFDLHCSFVNIKHHYPPFFTVNSLLHFTARLTFGSLPQKEIDQRVMSVMREWELLGYSHERLDTLSESARRRTLLANALVKDPLLLVVDDAVRDLEALSAYQLMLCAQTFAKRHNRIIMVSMRSARSDIYQLLCRTTVLFYGEVFYSGATKDLPAHFRNAGYPCPLHENPAVYYLSLATVDRETTERLVETQQKASELVEFYKETHPFRAGPFRANGLSYGIGSTVALSFLQQPSWKTKLTILINVNLLSGAWTVPYTAANFLQFEIVLLSMVYASISLHCYLPMRDLSFLENSYTQTQSFLAFICVSAPLQFISISIATVVFLWLLNLSDIMLYVEIYCVLLCISSLTQCLALCLAMLVKDPNRIMASVIFLQTIFIILGGFQRSVTNMPPWLFYLSFGSPFRHSNLIVTNQLIVRLPIDNCTRNEKSIVDPTSPSDFCRWPNAMSFRDEAWGSGFEPRDSPTNAVFLLISTLIAFLLAFLSAYFPKPKFVVDKITCEN